jgi:ribonuclease P protein component
MGSLKQRRLQGQTVFSHLLATKPLAANRYLAVHGVLTPSEMPFPAVKLGLIAGKRFAPHAHVRNRIKRVLRAQCSVEAAPSGACFVVRLRAPIGEHAYCAAFTAQAAQLWHTARFALLTRSLS